MNIRDGEWHSWWAWYPVPVEKGFAWRTCVEYRWRNWAPDDEEAMLMDYGGDMTTPSGYWEYREGGKCDEQSNMQAPLVAF